MTDYAKVVLKELHRWGINVTDRTAEHIAKTVLSQYDGTQSATHTMPAIVWNEHEDYRHAVLLSLKSRLAEIVTENNCVPIELPAETTKFVTWDNTPCDANSPDANAKITLFVKVRKIIDFTEPRALCACIGPSHSNLCPEWVLPT